MAGYDQGDLVCCHGTSDCPGGAGRTRQRGKLSVSKGLAVRDRAAKPVNAFAKFRLTAEIDADIAKIVAMSARVGLKTPHERPTLRTGECLSEFHCLECQDGLIFRGVSKSKVSHHIIRRSQKGHPAQVRGKHDKSVATIQTGHFRYRFSVDSARERGLVPALTVRLGHSYTTLVSA